ncbi:SCP2 sterol-binding domain-containing protein [Syncephalis pseudoplumigaleata]|uniref:SCP2 sterol-binding domain-containing protein n=1 Tax=Syncephalis pseudoplumigaleata TaxID=1712513 RepID=A0A4P9Z3I7_9FUNG|nr:SCP2 sterol-binding domain-containing protein [Syncephalis pseudoplumigaleata]|eukprot:RKP27113.1 SCP2 sterol-binding domain-containing protein [Syncephalis pseudoplumigaleata]
MSAAEVFATITAGLDALPDDKRAALVNDTKAVFVFDVKTKDGKQLQHTLNLKEGKGSSTSGAASKADITINVDDNTFVQLAQGKMKGQNAFMQGKLKLKGNMTLAMKLDKVLSSLSGPASKL